MGVNNSWRQPTTMADWMRDVEKRLMHEERRPQHAKTSDVVGTGIGTYSRLVEDWNSEGPIIDGFFYSIADSIINSPDDSLNWMGIVQANSIGQGLQRVWEYIDTAETPSPDPALWTRSFITNADGTRNYTPWLQGGGGGGGGTGAITVEDEGTPIGETAQLDFYGAGVTALMGTGEVQLTIDGTPKGPASGGLTGTYPGPTLAANSVGSAQIIDGSVGSAEIANGSLLAEDFAPGVIPAPVEVQDENVTVVSPLTLLDFQGPGVTVTPGAAGEAIVTIAGGGGGVGGVGQAGEIALWGTNGPPVNWLICDGSAISRTLYPDLFNAIGTTYGVGNGTTTFNLPNLKGRVPFGKDAAQAEFDVLGEQGGAKTHYHNVNAHQHNLVPHGHTTSQILGPTLDTVPTSGSQSLPRNAHYHTTDTSAGNTYLDANFGGATGTDVQSGLPPYLVINYIIRYQSTASVPGTVMIQDENATVQAADIINFLGPQVSAVAAGVGKVNVTISGDGTPIGPAGGDLTGTYPNPQIAADAVVLGDLAPTLKDGTAGSKQVRAIGAGATDAAAGNHVHGNPGMQVEDEGAAIIMGATKIDFKGAGVSATPDGVNLRAIVTIPGGGPPSGPAGGELSGTYPNPTIADNVIDSANVKDGSLTASDLVPGTIPTALPPSGPAGGDLTGTYPNPTIGVGKVTGSHILDGTIAVNDLGTQLVENGVSGGTAPTNAPALRRLGTLADDAAAGNHSHAALADGDKGDITITGGVWTIDPGAVTLGKMAPNSVDSSKIVDGSVAAADLVPGTIPTTLPPSGPAGGSLAGTYPNPTLAANSVGASQITDGSVGSAEIADGSIQAGDIAPGVIPTVPSTLPPSGAASGDLTGTYPSPQIAAGVIVDADVAAANKDGLAATPSMRTLGTGAQQAAAGNDTRLSNARVPTAHATTHQPGGSDPMAVDAAAATGSLRTLGTGAQQAAPGNDSRITGAASDATVVHKTGDETIAGVKTITDPLAFEEEGTSPAAPASGARFFTRSGRMWVRTPTAEYALAPEQVAVSLLVNGDYEQAVGAIGTQIIGWNGFWHGGTATLVSDNAYVATGLRSAKAHLDATSNDNVVVQTSDAFPVTGGGVLLLEFNARSGAQAGAQIDISLQSSVDTTDGAGTETGAPNFFAAGTFVTGAGIVYPVNGWTHYVKQFAVPAGHKLARLCLRVGKNTTVVDANTTQQDVWIDSAVAQMDTSASAGETLEWRSAGMRDPYSLPAGSAVTIPFRTDYGGTGITINTAGQLVIGSAGTYHVAVSMECTGTTYSDTYLYQWRAGTKIQTRNTVASGGGGGNWDVAVINGTFLCQAGDIFEVAASAGGASLVTVEINRSQFSIFKLAGPGPIGPAGEKGAKGDVGYADMSARLVYRGADFNPANAAPLTVDSYNVWPNDRILKVTYPNGAASDGIYTVTTAGTGSNGVWARATDADTPNEVYAANVKVGEGTIWGGTRWTCSIQAFSVIGTTNPHWACFAGDTGWIDVPFAAGISQYPSNDKCQYRRLNGIVYTKGLAILTGSAGTALIFTYPPGFRPNADQGPTHIPTAMQGAFGIVNTWKDGRVTHNTGPIGWCSLNYAPFPADN